MKIKLVAIAKDEAAYLPEWIFHHLYFGFDEIEIYLNFITDNSAETLEKITNTCPVKFKYGEYLIDPGYSDNDFILDNGYLNANTLQSRAYAESFLNAKKNGFSHIMFLDIDEFWMPACFSKNIKDVLIALDDPCVTAFIWANKVGEHEEFGRPFTKETKCHFTKMQKSAVKTGDEIKIMTSHHSTCKQRHKHKLIKTGEISDAYILHRFQRSIIEYTSLLGRGDPRFAGKFSLKFTRRGYISDENATVLTIDPEALNKYDNGYKEFIASNDLEEELLIAKKFVLERASYVTEFIRDNAKTNKLIKKIVTGLKLDDDIAADLGLRGLSMDEIEILKHMAVELEKEGDIEKAYQLMKIVFAFRSHGRFVGRKFEQYTKLTNRQHQ